MAEEKHVLEVLIKARFDKGAFKEVEKVLSDFQKTVKKQGGEVKTQFAKSKKSVESFGRTLKQGYKDALKPSKDFLSVVRDMQWSFLLLYFSVWRFSSALNRLQKDLIEAGKRGEEAFFRLAAASQGSIQNFEAARDAVLELTETGILTFEEAAEAVANLMRIGLAPREAVEVVKGLTARYWLMKTSMEGVGKEIVSITNSLVEQGRVVGKHKALYKSLIEQQLSAAEVQEILSLNSRTLTATMNRLKEATDRVKRIFGVAFAPILDGIAKKILSLTSHLQGFLENISGIGATVLAATSIFFSFLGGLTAIVVGAGALIKAFQVLQGALIGLAEALQAVNIWVTLSEMSLGKFMGLALGIPAILTLITLGILKATGRFEGFKERIAEAIGVARDFNNEFEAMQKIVEQTYATEEERAKQAMEDREIQHRRTVEDIKEQIEEELSKGLWADQQRIKDLRKRLKRENEDFALFQKRQKEEAEKRNEEKKDILDLFLEKNKTTAEEVKNLWSISFKDIVKEFEKLPPIVQGIFAGIATYLTITWGAKVLKAVATVVSGIIEKFAGIEISWGLLKTAISTPIAISIIVAAAITAIQAVRKEWQGLKEDIEGVNESIESSRRLEEKIAERIRGARTPAEREKWETIAKGLRESREEMEQIREETKTFWGALRFGFRSRTEEVGYRIRAWWEGYQFGGVVPGPRNALVPALLHGGERVIPAGEVGGSITININNPVVRTQQDIQAIANAVKDVLSQRNRWARLGAY